LQRAYGKINALKAVEEAKKYSKPQDILMYLIPIIASFPHSKNLVIKE